MGSAVILFACQVFAPTPTPTISDDCATFTEPTENDIDFSLRFGESLFDPNTWARSYTVEAQRVSVSWTNDNESAVAYLDYLIFSCGYTATDLEIYFGDSYWPILFQNYASFEPQRACGSFQEGLSLYEFEAVSNDARYHVRYWVRPENSTGVLTLFLVFPTQAEATMDKYAAEMFPTLVTCEE